MEVGEGVGKGCRYAACPSQWDTRRRQREGRQKIQFIINIGRGEVEKWQRQSKKQELYCLAPSPLLTKAAMSQNARWEEIDSFKNEGVSGRLGLQARHAGHHRWRRPHLILSHV